MKRAIFSTTLFILVLVTGCSWNARNGTVKQQAPLCMILN